MMELCCIRVLRHSSNPCFSMGLDARPAIEKFLYSGEEKKIDALVSLTGFSLVGGLHTMIQRQQNLFWQN